VATLLGNATAGLVAALMFRRTFGVALTPFYGVRRGDLRLILDVGRRLSRRGMGRRALAQVEEL
jgi:hypothetical protein